MARKERNSEIVAAAARRGARSVTRQAQIIDDAVEAAVLRWQKRIESGSEIADDAKWGYRVGANLAKRFGKGAKRFGPLTNPNLGDWALNLWTADGEDEAEKAGARRVLLAAIARRKKMLSPKQLLVARKLCEHGMSLHRAAKELGMDRANLRRLFARALRALAGG